jgi:hypothetical protein
MLLLHLCRSMHLGAQIIFAIVLIFFGFPFHITETYPYMISLIEPFKLSHRSLQKHLFSIRDFHNIW